jgi:DNA-binding NtrC family response regulator
MGKKILLIDDDELMRNFLATVLRQDGYGVQEAANGREGLAQFKAGIFDLVISDFRMPDLSGLDIMKQAAEISGDTPWIIITAYGSIDNAVEAMKAGAADYLTKPLRSPEELRHVVRNVLEKTEAQQRIKLISEEMEKQHPSSDLIFLGEKMQEVRRLVHDVADTPATVLITGPSGTGKELVARYIHNISARRERPFIAVHCAALTESLLESELFGHEKGAFTGAAQARKGRFELADGGTLLLDEIGEISPSTQVKLLRVLQERQIERVGGAKPLSVDVRVIAATNRNMKAAVAGGRFREDLYYRINVFPIEIPSLKDRKEAIIPLAENFVAKFSADFGKKITGITEAARDKLLAYPWPGNIRELQNIMERAVIIARTEINAAHLNLEPPGEDAPGGLIKAGEKELILKALKESGGNRKKAAAELGISLRTLQYRLKEYGIT